MSENLSTRVCRKCNIEKNITDFCKYGYKDNDYKFICKRCENTRSSRKDLWKCNVCDITIRKEKKKNHLKCQEHLRCYFFNDSYNLNILKKQNCRK